MVCFHFLLFFATRSRPRLPVTYPRKPRLNWMWKSGTYKILEFDFYKSQTCANIFCFSAGLRSKSYSPKFSDWEIPVRWNHPCKVAVFLGVVCSKPPDYPYWGVRMHFPSCCWGDGKSETVSCGLSKNKAISKSVTSSYREQQIPPGQAQLPITQLVFLGGLVPCVWAHPPCKYTKLFADPRLDSIPTWLFGFGKCISV